MQRRPNKVNPLFSSKTKDTKAKYTLEKTYNKRLNKHYQTITKLNKKETDLTDQAEKAFEAIEQKHKDQVNSLIETFKDQKYSLETTHKKHMKTQEETIKDLETTHKENIKALELDFKKSTLFIKDDIELLTQERAIKVKEIEKKYLEHNVTYQEKLDLYKQNLEKNKVNTINQFEEAIATLKDLLNDLEQDHTTQTKLETLLTRFNKDLQKAFDAETDYADTLAKNATYTMNSLRKELNQYIKTITLGISKTKSALEAPFSQFKDALKTFKLDTDKQKDVIDQDYTIEKIQLDAALENAKNAGDDATAKDLETRLKLTERRHNTLIKQQDLITNLIDEEAQFISTWVTEDVALIDTIYDQQETLINEHQTHLKDLFTTVEDHLNKSTELTKTITDKTHIKEHYNTITSYIDTCIKAINTFHKERLTAYINDAQNMKPLITEMDEIRTTLDTIEPLKEIEINKQKMTIDQEDASVRFDMKEAKLTHDLNHLTIDHDTRIKKHTLLHNINILSSLEDKQNLEATQAYEKAHLDLEEKEALAKANFLKKQEHIDADKKRSMELYIINKEKQETERDINLTSLEKEFTLETYDLEQEIKEHTKKQAYEIDRTKKALEVALLKKQKQEASKTKHYEADKQAIIDEYNTQEAKIQQDIDAARKRLSDQQSFIDKALEKETSSPKTNIRNINAMIKTRIELITEHTQPLTEQLDAFEIARKPHKPELKSLLRLIASPFEYTIKSFIQDIYSVKKESLNFVYNVKQKHIEQETISEKKKQSLLAKHEADHQKTLDQLDKDKTQLERTYLKHIHDTKARITSLDRPTLTRIKEETTELFKFINSTYKKEVKDIVDTITAAFQSLVEKDQALVINATENHKKAHKKARENYETTVKPLNQALSALKIDKTQALNAFNEKQTKTVSESLDSINTHIDNLRTKIQTLEEEKTNLEASTQDKINTLTQEYEDAKRLTLESHKDAIKRLEASHEKHIQKLDTRMQEAKNLYDYETDMFKQERTIIEDKRNESITEHAETKAQKAKTYDKELLTIQEDKQLKKAELDETLKTTNQAFETKILNSAARLETLIESTTRKIDQEGRLKKERLDTLNTRIMRLEDDVYTRVDDAHNTLTETLNATHKAFLQNLPTYESYDTFQETNETYFDTLIRKTVKAITERD